MQNILKDGDGVSLSISIMGNGGTGFREREQYPLIYLKENDFRFQKKEYDIHRGRKETIEDGIRENA